MKTTGERIKEIRLAQGETLEKFGIHIAKKLGLSEDEAPGKSNVSKWEKGFTLPNKERLKAIAQLGNTTVDQLLNSNPLSDYSTDELLQELERRGS